MLRMLSRDRASLVSGTAGTWDSSLRQQGQGCSRDKAAAGMLGYWKSFIGASASAGGWHRWVKSGKSLPRVQVINPSATTEECSR